jgi:hypothetical protein
METAVLDLVEDADTSHSGLPGKQFFFEKKNQKTFIRERNSRFHDEQSSISIHF